MLYERKLIQGRVLDYGCGFGQDGRFLRAKGFDAHDYDPYHAPTLPTGTFDTIVCFLYVLNVLFPDEQTAVLMDISRLLKPSGRAYFSDVGTLAGTVSERISYTASRFISAT